MDKLSRRKVLRLKEYDYSQAGYYFVTICTHNRQKILSEVVDGSHDIVGGGFHATPHTVLTPIGEEIIKTIEYMNNQYSGVFYNYVTMPNHVHMLIVLHGNQSGGYGNPPLQKIVGTFKSFTNRRYNELNKTKNLILWQRNYYEHIIRNEIEYQKIYEYIETNPIKWVDDEYY